jgi:tetratricopeptide (TPR) repeat protein
MIDAARTRFLRLAASVMALSLTLASTPVAAGPNDSSRRPTAPMLYEQGEAEYKVGNIDAAIELFSRGYALEPRPEFLLNLAQCYRALGRRTEAILHFERFIKAAPDHPLRPNAEKTLEELRRAEALERIANQPSPQLQPQPVTALEPTKPVPAKEPSEPKARSRAWIYWTVGALGALTVGGTLYLVTRSPSVDDTIRLPQP